MSEFGIYLKQLRKDKKISQRALADLIGIDFTYLSKIESGVMPPPAEERIIKIAEVLKIDPDELLIIARKVPSDFNNIILQDKNVPIFLRKAPDISKEQWTRIHKIIDNKEEK